MPGSVCSADTRPASTLCRLSPSGATRRENHLARRDPDADRRADRHTPVGREQLSAVERQQHQPVVRRAADGRLEDRAKADGLAQPRRGPGGSSWS